MSNLLQSDTAEVCGKGRSERNLSAALTRVGMHPGDVAVSAKGTPFARTARSIERACDRLAAQFDVRRVRHRLAAAVALDAFTLRTIPDPRPCS
jgi:hypothetical protein